MDRDTIIRLAREAGDNLNKEWLVRFAALIETHLKERGYRQCAKGQKTTQFCGMLEEAVKAEREACAKVVEAEQARVLGKQEGESWEPVNINIRMTAVLLPDIAAAIRSRT